MYEVRRHIGERGQDERALGDPRVRDDKIGGVHMLVTDHKHVDVQRARTPPLLAHASGSVLQPVRDLQQRPGRQRCLDRDHCVQVGRLRWPAYGIGLVHGRDADHQDAFGRPQAVDRALQAR